MTTGSVQLRRYIRAIRAGEDHAAAAEQHGIGREEARLTDIAEARGEFADLDLSDPETAGCAVTHEEEIVMQDDAEDQDLPATELASDTLRGDVRDAFLSWFKATPKPWSAMSEIEQRDFAARADGAARHLVREVCKHVAAAERKVIVAKLVEYKEKDGVEAKLKLPSTGEVVAALHEACGQEVLIVASGEEAFLGEAGPAEIDADQPDFPNLGQEYDEAA